MTCRLVCYVSGCVWWGTFYYQPPSREGFDHCRCSLTCACILQHWQRSSASSRSVFFPSSRHRQSPSFRWTFGRLSFSTSGGWNLQFTSTFLHQWLAQQGGSARAVDGPVGVNSVLTRMAYVCAVNGSLFQQPCDSRCWDSCILAIKESRNVVKEPSNRCGGQDCSLPSSSAVARHAPGHRYSMQSLSFWVTFPACPGNELLSIFSISSLTTSWLWTTIGATLSSPWCSLWQHLRQSFISVRYLHATAFPMSCSLITDRSSHLGNLGTSSGGSTSSTRQVALSTLRRMVWHREQSRRWNGYYALLLIRMQLYLQYRTTTLESGYSPDHLLFSRQLRTGLPITHEQRRPVVPDTSDVLQCKKDLQKRQETNFNAHHGACPFPPLPMGSTVFIPDRQEAGQVVSNPACRSYVVVTPSGEFRRNRCQINPLPTTEARVEPSSKTSGISDTSQAEKQPPASEQPPPATTSTQPEQTTESPMAPEVVFTRSGRTVQPPSRFGGGGQGRRAKWIVSLVRSLYRSCCHCLMHILHISLCNYIHHIRLNWCMRSDLAWWVTFLPIWNGTSMMSSTIRSPPRAVVTSDTSNWGCGAVSSLGQRFQLCWPPSWGEVHITFKELVPVVTSIVQWGYLWKGSTILCRCDNVAVVSILNTGGAPTSWPCT